MVTDRNDEFISEIKKRLSPYRIIHSLNVAEEAKKLAEKYGANPDKAYTAGLVHDIMKDTPDNEQLELLYKHGYQLSETELKSPKTRHAVSGEAFLKYEFKVDDEEILTAVRYHTTARAGMSLLEKVLYIADYISADRDYPDVDVMREKSYRSLEEAMLYGLQFTIMEMVEKGLPIHEDSILAYNEVAILQKDKQKKGTDKC